MSFDACLISCEHASNRVPSQWSCLFDAAGPDLGSHRGWDPGARPTAEAIAGRLNGELLIGEWTRLLVDLNRSPDNPRRFSRYTRELTGPEREAIDAEFHRPYQQAGRRWVEAHARGHKRVIHLTVHSFTPVLDGRRRTTDLGLLHVTDRGPEVAFMKCWKSALGKALPELTVHRNQPYTGRQDGYIPWMHRHFEEGVYCGIELEINQRLLTKAGRLPAPIEQSIIATFIDSLGDFE